MKANHLILTVLLAAALWTCGDKGGGKQGGDLPEITTANITDAKALYLTGTASAGRAADEEGKLFKITEAGTSSEVSFRDKDGKEIEVEVLELWKVSDDYIILAVNVKNTTGQLVEHTLFGTPILVRKRDGAAFKMESSDARDMVNNVGSRPSTLMVDMAGRLYWLANGLYQSTPLSDDGFSAKLISGELENLRCCYMDSKEAILIATSRELICRFPDGTFTEGEQVPNIFSYLNCFPIKNSPDGGFVYLEQNSQIEVGKLVADKTEKKIVRTPVAQIPTLLLDRLKRDDLPDGGYVFYTDDYKDYIFISPTGNVETKSYPTGFN